MSSPEYSSDEENDNPYKLITRRIDTPKIRNKKRKDVFISTSFTKNINIERNGPVRSGVIIYTRKNNKTFFCLGVDADSKDLTDFGGGVTKDETVVEGGLRELKEESQGIFGAISVEEIENTISFCSYNMAIIFIPKDVDMDKITKDFNSKIEKTENFEVSGIKWLDTEELLESIHGRGKKLYVRVVRLLSKVTNTINEF